MICLSYKVDMFLYRRMFLSFSYCKLSRDSCQKYFIGKFFHIHQVTLHRIVSVTLHANISDPLNFLSHKNRKKSFGANLHFIKIQGDPWSFHAALHRLPEMYRQLRTAGERARNNRTAPRPLHQRRGDPRVLCFSS